MAKFIPYINPIRFRPYANISGGFVDNDMPRVDKMANQTQYYKGIYPIDGYKADWKLNETIVIQMQSSDSNFVPKHIYLTTPSGIISINGVNVTPSGWVGDAVYNYEYIPTEIGDYYFTTIYSNNVNWISDVFYVHPNEMNLVEFQYYDTKNSFDGVFYDDTTLIWQPKAYFTGIAIAGNPKRELSIYTNDPNIPTITRGETQRTIDVSLTDITIHHYSQLIDILSCDTIFVNKQPALSIEDLDPGRLDKSDGTNMSFNMIRIEDDNFVKNY